MRPVPEHYTQTRRKPTLKGTNITIRIRSWLLPSPFQVIGESLPLRICNREKLLELVSIHYVPTVAMYFLKERQDRTSEENRTLRANNVP